MTLSYQCVIQNFEVGSIAVGRYQVGSGTHCYGWSGV